MRVLSQIDRLLGATMRAGAVRRGAAAAVLLSLGAAAPGLAQEREFRVIGRLQLDYTSAEADLTGFTDSWSDSEIRRGRIGVEGSEGRVSYRAEVTIDESEALWEDAWIELEAGKVTLIAGQWKAPVSLNQQTSSRHITSLERASFVEAFGFARRLGVGVAASGERYTFKAGVFDDNVNDDPGALALGTAAAARVTFNPVMQENRIVHLGASAQYREADDDGGLFRYRARPGIHLSDRFIDTGAVAESDTFLGAEAGLVAGRLHLSVEYATLAAEGPGVEADLQGGYVEGGFFLTAGDSKGYRNGAFDRTRPQRSINDGGIGAWELRGRVDWIDLDDGPVAGGEQTAYTLGVNWFATDYLRFMAELTRAEVEGGPDGSGDVDSASVRAAIDW